MTGQHPPSQIDHINGIPNDNRWENLRLATPTQNAWNKKGRQGKSGAKGVIFIPSSGKWLARCKMAGVEYRLGHFDEVELAAACLSEFRLKHQGEFAHN